MLKTEGKVSWVTSLTVCGDVLISGHLDRSMCVLNKTTGHCDHVLRGHTGRVTCLAVPREWVIRSHHQDLGSDSSWVIMAVPRNHCCAHGLGSVTGNVERPSNQKIRRQEDHGAQHCESTA